MVRRMTRRRRQSSPTRAVSIALMLGAVIGVGNLVKLSPPEASTPAVAPIPFSPTPVPHTAPKVAPGATPSSFGKGDYLDQLFEGTVYAPQTRIAPKAHKAADRAAVYADPRKGRIAIEGMIKPGNADDLAKALRRMERSPMITITLASSGGDFAESMEMTAALRAYQGRGNKLVAFVPAGKVCASSCVTLFATADRRYVGRMTGLQDGSIYVHTPAVDDGENTQTMAIAVRWSRLLSMMGTPDGVTAKLINTGSREGTRVSSADMRAWGVTVIGPTGVASLP